ncbi:MAG TPA: NAD(P)H-hydrate dehydratase, partial [Bacteroidetes bacterium]|nr:NAD(P)H-hydrate dehydratase [Bacteroidota bacterium]
MQPVLEIGQIREWDKYTIENEPISSIDLMERAATAFTKRFLEITNIEDQKILIISSKGNNGGDGLVVGRKLNEKGLDVDILIADIQSKGSSDFNENLSRLDASRIPYGFINKNDEFPDFKKYDFIIDGLFGSGLHRPISGYWAELVEEINNSKVKIFSIDIPSGMYSDKPSDGIVIKADTCITFETMKLGMLIPENSPFLKNIKTVSIGLKKEYLDSIKITNFLIEKKDIKSILKPRNKFDHKGKYGHALIVGGSKGMIGASSLASKACLVTGAGLVSALIPDVGYSILQTSIPEVMILSGYGNDFLSAVPELNKYAAIGIGPGLGKHDFTRDFLKDFLGKVNSPLVIDADALNIIAENNDLLEIVPKNSILTPHPGEFSRLFGPSLNSFERLKLLRAKAKKHKLFIILKGANTAIATPDGILYFNTTGNPGMATAGSGDVLS